LSLSVETLSGEKTLSAAGNRTTYDLVLIV